MDSDSHVLHLWGTLFLHIWKERKRGKRGECPPFTLRMVGVKKKKKKKKKKKRGRGGITLVTDFGAWAPWSKGKKGWPLHYSGNRGRGKG